MRIAPDRFLELTDQEGIKPGKYVHRFHWITIVRPESVHAALLKELVVWSREKALHGLTLRATKELRLKEQLTLKQWSYLGDAVSSSG